MKAMVLACVLPLMVAAGAWVLVDELRESSVPDRPAGRVPPFVAADSSGNGNDGIIQGDTRVGLPGEDGTSYSFVHRGSWVQVASAPEISPGSQDFLVSAWVRFDEYPRLGETFDVVRKGVGVTKPGEFRMEVLPTGRVRCTAKDEDRNVATVTSIAVVPDDGTWHQIGCARTRGVSSVLVDDTLRTRAAALGPVANTVPLSIGPKYGLEDRPRSRVDDVKLFIGPSSDPTTLTEPDVSVALGALEGERPAGWWRLDEAAPSAAGR